MYRIDGEQRSAELHDPTIGNSFLLGNRDCLRRGTQAWDDREDARKAAGAKCLSYGAADASKGSYGTSSRSRDDTGRMRRHPYPKLSKIRMPLPRWLEEDLISAV